MSKLRGRRTLEALILSAALIGGCDTGGTGADAGPVGDTGPTDGARGDSAVDAARSDTGPMPDMGMLLPDTGIDGGGGPDACATCTPLCGDSHTDIGEVCDDGNTVDGDGCDHNCTVTACGNGVSTTPETCDDGNAVDGDGCDDNCTTTACGNGITTGTETCDDGNTADGDGCDTNCTTTACGNGVTTGTETCDDGNIVDGDGCDTNCTTTACGNGAVSPGEMCDDGNTTNGDGCDSNCTTTACGNGVVTSGEMCDDGNATNGDGCDSNCTATACGNGVVTPGEECDDGNTDDTDTCSTLCHIQRVEMEPNEDGTPSPGATAAGTTPNDFDATAIANADANGAVQTSEGSVIIHATLSLGDEDVFAVHNDGTAPANVRLDTWNAMLGIGVACGTSIDLVVHVYDATLTQLASNDDRNGGTDRCAGLALIVPPGATIYVHVMFYDDNATASYLLQIASAPFVCGDGVAVGSEACDDGNIINGDGCDNNCTASACGNGVPAGTESCDDGNTTSGDGCDNNCTATACGNGVATTGEQCDDGNLVNGDGCSSVCHVEGIGSEIEPNDTTAAADANGLVITNDVAIQGAISATTDADVYRVVVATGTVLRSEIVTALNPEDCVGGTADLRLLDATGTQIIQDTGATGGGIGTCGGVVIYLAPGTYYLRVANNVVTPNYFLLVDYQTSAGSESEAPGVMGVNDSQLTASVNFGTTAPLGSYVFGDHQLTGDADWYAVTVPNGARIRAEVIEGDRATETCEGNGVDSQLTLYDQTGTVLVADDDDGRGFCSLIDGRGTTPNDAAARNASGGSQTYFFQVNQSAFATGAGALFVYRLSVAIR